MQKLIQAPSTSYVSTTFLVKGIDEIGFDKPVMHSKLKLTPTVLTSNENRIKQFEIILPEFIRNNNYNNIIHFSEGAFLFKKQMRPEFYKNAMDYIEKMGLKKERNRQLMFYLFYTPELKRDLSVFKDYLCNGEAVKSVREQDWVMIDDDVVEMLLMQSYDLYCLYKGIIKIECFMKELCRLLYNFKGSESISWNDFDEFRSQIVGLSFDFRWHD